MESYGYAAEHEGELNGRQREVLRLLAGGRTNAEIAGALDITLDGAKWNVSEILSKLGFASREEAAAYWRWRNRPAARLQRLARALVPVGGLKLAAGGSALAVAGVAAAVVLVLALRDGDDEPIPPGPFTATIHVEVQPEGGQSTVRWWHQDNRHYRYEISGPPVGGRTLTAVADGQWLWSDSATETTYQRTEIPDLPAGTVASLPISVLIGPSNTGTFDAFLDELRSINRAPGAFARVTGSAHVLGYDTTVVEWGPAWSSSGSANGGPATVTTGGVSRLWVEPRSLWVLRFESDGLDGERIRAEITGLDFGGIDPARFVFEPPAGKAMGPASDAASGAVSDDGYGNPSRVGWYLVPAMPAGYGIRSWEGNARDPSGSSTTWLVHQSGSSKELEQNPYVRIFQGPSAAFAGTPAAGDPVTLANGLAATVATEAGGIIQLVFDDGETRVTLTTNALSRDELAAFAGTLRKHR